MADYIASLEVLAEQFGRLAGVGKRTAMRLAFSVIDMSREEAENFARAIIEAKEKIHLCPVCQNLTDLEVCPICADPTRDHSTICVVQDTKAVMSMERDLSCSSRRAVAGKRSNAGQVASARAYGAHRH